MLETFNKMTIIEKEIAKWEDTRWIVGSSYFFMIPAFFYFFRNLYFYSILLGLTSIISANYWRKATYSWRRNMDLVFAKITFSVFFYNGVFYVTTRFYRIIGYSGLLFIIYFYYLSNKLFKMGNPNWWKFHCFFHFLMTIEQLIILDSIYLSRQIK